MQNIKTSFTSIQSDMTKTSVKAKQPFTEPKLTFIVPKLVKQGSVEEITAGFFGPIYP